MSHAPAPWRWVIPGPMGEETFEDTFVPVDWATWKAKGYYDNPKLVDADGNQVVDAGGGEYTAVHGETEELRTANARVLEAAPDLLAALKALTSNPHLDLGDETYQVREREGLGWDGPSVKAWSDAVGAASAAIRKAEGK